MRPLARLRGRRVVPQRSAGELDAMAAAGAVVAAALRAIRAAAAPGTSSLSLDEIAESVIRESGATPSFLGYHGYPASICASINDRVVHGIRRPPRCSRPVIWYPSTAVRCWTVGMAMRRSLSGLAP